MTDIEIAKAHLEDHSICLCRDGDFFTDDGRGISPMMRLIAEGRDLKDYSAADQIVGKAAAMLFVLSGIKAVYGKVMSEAAKRCLTEHHIPYSYDILIRAIINRRGDGICPMEQAVADIDNPEDGYQALQRRLAEMRGRQSD